MRIEVCGDAAAAAARAAEFLAAQTDNAIARRGLATIALSGGKTPTTMLSKLALASIDWRHVHVFQVDERLVGSDDERRNMRSIQAAFGQSTVPAGQLHAMPTGLDSLADTAEAYARELCEIAGRPPVLDVVHLGLGKDGHTASLFPGEAAVDAEGEIALSGIHGGMRRMTLTLRVINLARMRLWLVTGASKRECVRRLLDPGSGLVANRVRRRASVLFLDRDAAALIQ